MIVQSSFTPESQRMSPGHGVAVESRQARSVLTPATGFLRGYQFTLNPYSGCAFGCSYCYARFFAGSAARRDTWGGWVSAKENAPTLLARECASGRLRSGDSVYMSSVTDPYQPAEARLRITRELLEVLLAYDMQPRLTVQTRSPLVTRDIDLIQRFEYVRVNMTISTTLTSCGVATSRVARRSRLGSRLLNRLPQLACASACRSVRCSRSSMLRRLRDDCSN